MPKITHNKTNYDSFNALMEKRNELIKEKETSNRKLQAKKNLIDWINELPDHYKNSDLRLFTSDSLMPIKPSMQKRKIPYRTVIYGAPGSGKLFYTYGLIKELIYRGLITPAEIRWTGIREASEAVVGGFQKQAWRDNFFDESAKLFIVKGTSRQFSDLGIRGSERFWGEFSQFVNEHHKAVIIIYDINTNKELQLSNDRNRWYPYISTSQTIVGMLLTKSGIFIRLTPASHKKARKQGV